MARWPTRNLLARQIGLRARVVGLGGAHVRQRDCMSRSAAAMAARAVSTSSPVVEICVTLVVAVIGTFGLCAASSARACASSASARASATS